MADWEVVNTSPLAPEPQSGGGWEVAGKPKKLTRDDYIDYAISGAEKRGLRPDVALSLFKQESDFNPDAKSPTGVRGVSQTTLATGRKHKPDYNEADRSNPFTSIDVGLDEFSELYKKHGNYPKAVFHYNGGSDPKFEMNVGRHLPWARGEIDKRKKAATAWEPVGEPTPLVSEYDPITGKSYKQLEEEFVPLPPSDKDKVGGFQLPVEEMLIAPEAPKPLPFFQRQTETAPSSIAAATAPELDATTQTLAQFTEPAGEMVGKGINIPFIPLEMAAKAVSDKALRPVLDYAFPKATAKEKEMVQGGFEFVSTLGLAPTYLRLIGRGAQLLKDVGKTAFYRYAPDAFFRTGEAGLPVPLAPEQIRENLMGMSGAQRAEMVRKYPQFRDVMEEMTAVGQGVETTAPGAAVQPQAPPIPQNQFITQALQTLADSPGEAKQFQKTIMQAYARLHPEAGAKTFNEVAAAITPEDLAVMREKVPKAAKMIETLEGRIQQQAAQDEALMAQEQAMTAAQVQPPPVDMARPAAGPLFTPEQMKSITHEELLAMPPEQQKIFKQQLKEQQKAEAEKEVKAEPKKATLKRVKKAPLPPQEAPVAETKAIPQVSPEKGVEETTGTPTTITAPKAEAKLGSEFGMRGLAAKRYTVDGHIMGDTPQEAVRNYQKAQEDLAERKIVAQKYDELLPKLKSGNYTDIDIKSATTYGKTTVTSGEAEGWLRNLGLKSTEARKLILSTPHVSESARGTMYYDLATLVEKARRKGFLPKIIPVEGAPLTKVKRERELLKATEPPAPQAGREAKPETAGKVEGDTDKKWAEDHLRDLERQLAEVEKVQPPKGWKVESLKKEIANWKEFNKPPVFEKDVLASYVSSVSDLKRSYRIIQSEDGKWKVGFKDGLGEWLEMGGFVDKQSAQFNLAQSLTAAKLRGEDINITDKSLQKKVDRKYEEELTAQKEREIERERKAVEEKKAREDYAERHALSRRYYEELETKAKTLKSKKGEFEITTSEGNKEKISGNIYENFAINKAGERDYVITHLNTGYKIASLDSVKDARLAVYRLNNELKGEWNWHKPADIPQKVKDNGPQIIHQIKVGEAPPEYGKVLELTPSARAARNALAKDRGVSPDSLNYIGSESGLAWFNTKLPDGKETTLTWKEAPTPKLRKVKKGELGAVGVDLKAAQAETTPESVKQAQDKIKGRISRDESFDRPSPWGFSRIYTNIVDRFHPLQKMVKAYSPQGLLASKDPYAQTRLIMGWLGKAESFLQYHPFNRSKMEFETNIKSLKKIVEPLEKAGQLENFDDFLVARRALERAAKGFETGVDQAAAQAVVDHYGPQFAQDAKDFDKFMDAVLRYHRDSGLISKERYQQIKDGSVDYAPFLRLMEQEQRQAGGKGFEARQVLKKFKGSERKIISPLESSIKLTYLMINAAERNHVGRTFVEWAKESGAMGTEVSKAKAKMFPVKTTWQELMGKNYTPEMQAAMEEGGVSPEDLLLFRPSGFRPAKDVIAVWEDGKRKFYHVPEDIADIFGGLDEQSSGFWLRLFSAPAQALRLGATILSPEFGVRNFLKDQFPAYIHSQHGFKPFIDFFKGVTELAQGGEKYWQYMISGAGHAELVSMDRRLLQKKLKDLASGKINIPGFIVRHPIEAMKILSEYSERGTRLGQFIKALRAGESIEGSGLSARELTTDFGRRGAATKAINMLSAFWNANVQGLDRVVRAHKTNPWGTMAKAAAALTLPAILLEVAFHDDDRYKNLPWWRRDMFFNIPSPVGVISLPKPWTYGLLYGAIPQRITNFILNQDPHAFDGLLTAIGRETPDVPIPTLAKPFLEAWANKSFFFDRPIVPKWKEDLPPKYQYNEYNSETVKYLGRIIGKVPYVKDTSAASPAIIEHFVYSWTGGAGRMALNAVDYTGKKTGLINAVPAPAHTLADIPVVRAFVSRYPSANAQPIKDFYDNAAKIEANKKGFKEDIKRLAQRGQGKQAAALLDDLTAADFMNLTDTKKALSNSHKYIEMVYNHPDMSPEMKREAIEKTYLTMINITSKLNAAIDKVRKKPAKAEVGKLRRLEANP